MMAANPISPLRPFNGAAIPKGDRVVLPVERIEEFETRMTEHFARRPAPRRK